jgi:nucleotide-binding universal stress UspA family protein
MYQRIMVTVDGSQLARAAIDQAKALVAGTGTEVVVFEAVEPAAAVRSRLIGEAYEFTGGRAEAIDELAQSQHFVQRDEALREVEEAAAQLRAAGAEVTTEVTEGIPGNAILDAAERHGVDAIVMATRGHGGLGREVVGSVAEYVLRHAGGRAVILTGPRAVAPTGQAAVAGGAAPETRL